MIDYSTYQVESNPWFAWYPVRTVENNIVWWKWVTRVVDYKPETYQGLLPTVYYYE